jgi:hypothetical protein
MAGAKNCLSLSGKSEFIGGGADVGAVKFAFCVAVLRLSRVL